MKPDVQYSNKQLDQEWVHLISIAKNKGLSVAEFHSFLRKKKAKGNHKG